MTEAGARGGISPELQKAAALISAGRKAEARTLLVTHLKENPESDMGWLMLSYVIDDPEKQRESVRQALQANPENIRAQARMKELVTRAAFELEEIPQPTTQDEELEDEGPPLPDDYELEPFREIEPSPSPRFVSEAFSARLEGEDDVEEDEDASPIPPVLRSVSIPLLIILILAICLGCIVALFAVLRMSNMSVPSILPTSTASAVAELQSSGGQQLPENWTATPQPMASSTPLPSAKPLASATPTLSVPHQDVLAEMEILHEQVSNLRGLAAHSGSTAYLLTRPEVRPILEGYFFTHGGSEDEIQDLSTVLTALGLIEPDYDLMTYILNGLGDSIGGFYFPETDQIFIIGYRFSAIERFIYAHEYDHALVDESFDLAALGVYPKCQLNSDRCRAIQALVEGDAVLLMIQWWEQSASPTDYKDIARYAPPRQLIPEQYPPPYALLDAEFAYMDGLAFVEGLYALGGWEKVNEAYGRLPTSSEQILHPEKYFSEESPIDVQPQPLDDTLGPGWMLVLSDTLGEWFTFLILGYGAEVESQLDENLAAEAAAGWGGDTFQIFTNDESSEILLVAHWNWDTSSDAEEHENAMRLYLDGRFSGSDVDSNQGDCWDEDNQVSCILRDGEQTLWILSPTMDLLNKIVAVYGPVLK
ncbi:MAG: hypothetical protein GTO18_07025 [Anaerolineales bacterium]|nr:hypothetical protein [Anaerolineales bacterium]